MKIFFIFFLIVMAIVLVSRKFFYSAKINLFKDQASWSGKDIKIKYRNSKEISKSKEKNNYLEMIADESKFYLENQSKNKEDKDA